jgi:hypothetical protein
MRPRTTCARGWSARAACARGAAPRRDRGAARHIDLVHLDIEPRPPRAAGQVKGMHDAIEEDDLHRLFFFFFGERGL